MGCFSSAVTEPLVRFNGIMYQKAYKNLLVRYAIPTLLKCRLRIFQHENYPNHTAKSVKLYLSGKRFPANVTEWPSKDPDLNRIENLWALLDYKVLERKIKTAYLNHFMQC